MEGEWRRSERRGGESGRRAKGRDGGQRGGEAEQQSEAETRTAAAPYSECRAACGRCCSLTADDGGPMRQTPDVNHPRRVRVISNCRSSRRRQTRLAASHTAERPHSTAHAPSSTGSSGRCGCSSVSRPPSTGESVTRLPPRHCAPGSLCLLWLSVSSRSSLSPVPPVSVSVSVSGSSASDA